MSKIKDTIEEEKEWANKELEASEPKGYKFDSEKHYHSFENKPLLGCSTVVGVLSKNLTWWSAELSAVECLEVGEKIPTIREEYLEAKKKGKEGIDELQKKYPIFKKARFAHFVDKNEKADKGTDLHAELERFVKNTMENRMATYDEKIIPFITWTEENVDKFLWSEMHGFSDKLWVGGISDVGVKLKNGKVGIIDFKSSKDSYDSQFIQCAGYDILVSENGGYTEDGKKVFQLDEPIEFYAVVPFGSPKFKVDFRYNVEELREGFKSCVQLYKLTNY
jgi:hypothetical protein